MGEKIISFIKNGRRVDMSLAKFEEEKHPRDSSGKWTSGGGGDKNGNRDEYGQLKSGPDKNFSPDKWKSSLKDNEKNDISNMSPVNQEQYRLYRENGYSHKEAMSDFKPKEINPSESMSELK